MASGKLFQFVDDGFFQVTELLKVSVANNQIARCYQMSRECSEALWHMLGVEDAQFTVNLTAGEQQVLKSTPG